MNYSVKNTERFAKELGRLIRKYPSLKSEFVSVISSLEDDSIDCTPVDDNFYKITLEIPAKKYTTTGVAKIVILVKFRERFACLATIYDRSEKADITSSELTQVLSMF
jgi:hypothetical protein